MRKFRKGDRVMVMGTVNYEHCSGPDIGVMIDGHASGTAYIDRDHLQAVSQKIDVGDFVIAGMRMGETLVTRDCAGLVLAVHDGSAWIRDADGKDHIRRTEDMERAERPPEYPEAL